MNEKIKRDLLKTIGTALRFVQTRDAGRLKELSNHNIHNASIFQDEFSTTMCVIIYSLSKIITNSGFNHSRMYDILKKMHDALTKDDFESYRYMQKKAMDYIKSFDERFSSFITEVLTQAQIKKGWKLYDHGLSIESSAKLLGISQWDLMNYIGNIKSDFEIKKTDVKSRINFTRGLFK